MFDEQSGWDQAATRAASAPACATALCLSHTAERVPDAFDDELSASAPRHVDARGVVLGSSSAAGHDPPTRERARPPSGSAVRSGQVQARGAFGKVRFLGDADFMRARFEGFGDVLLRGHLPGRGRVRPGDLEGYASFSGATFKDAPGSRRRTSRVSCSTGELRGGARFHVRSSLGGRPSARRASSGNHVHRTTSTPAPPSTRGVQGPSRFDWRAFRVTRGSGDKLPRPSRVRRGTLSGRSAVPRGELQTGPRGSGRAGQAAGAGWRGLR